ncbi:S1 family peptidase [Mucilaginibacter sp.]|uniref:S1 family peptidase n=1 Tax=Mucilaginibacter sp. TaxID=1882438 RepID=UPI003D0D0549
MPIKKTLTGLLLVTGLPLMASAQRIATGYIYQVYAGGQNAREITTETGFICKKYKGILTALHGVIGKTVIYAINEAGTPVNDLYIVQVDVANDIALLGGPSSLDKVQGLDVGDEAGLVPGQELKVYGHPVGMKLNIKTVTAGDPVMETLDHLIPTKSTTAFINRKSPEIDRTILYIDGPLVQGHSGAPVFKGNKVLGVANGGVRGGAAGISWAIPISKIDLHDIKTAGAALGLVAASHSDDLFSLDVLQDIPDGLKLVYNVTPQLIPYALGQFDDASQLFVIDFSAGDDCRGLPFQCTNQPLGRLPAGNYTCEIIYRPAKVGHQAAIGFNNWIAYVTRNLQKDAPNTDPANTLAKKEVAYDEADFSMDGFKTLRMNFVLDKPGQSISVPVFGPSHNFTLWIKGIRIYQRDLN